MLRAIYILAIASLLGLTGCVQMREREYYHPTPRNRCVGIPVIVHPSETWGCERYKDIVRDLGGDKP